MGCQSIYEGQSRSITTTTSSSYKELPKKSSHPRTAKPKAKRAPKSFGKNKR